VASAEAIIASLVDLNEHYCCWDSLHQELLLQVHKRRQQWTQKTASMTSRSKLFILNASSAPCDG
jgi:hypothetical protein